MLTTDKGRLAEAKVIAFLVEAGHEVYIPIGGNTSCDLVSILGSSVKRVEVKYVGNREIQLRQTRHNRSQHMIKKFDSSQCDMLAAYIALEDRVILFEAAPLHGRSTLAVPFMDL